MTAKHCTRKGVWIAILIMVVPIALYKNHRSVVNTWLSTSSEAWNLLLGLAPYPLLSSPYPVQLPPSSAPSILPPRPSHFLARCPKHRHLHIQPDSKHQTNACILYRSNYAFFPLSASRSLAKTIAAAWTLCSASETDLSCPALGICSGLLSPLGRPACLALSHAAAAARYLGATDARFAAGRKRGAGVSR